MMGLSEDVVIQSHNIHRIPHYHLRSSRLALGEKSDKGLPDQRHVKPIPCPRASKTKLDLNSLWNNLNTVWPIQKQARSTRPMRLGSRFAHANRAQRPECNTEGLLSRLLQLPCELRVEHSPRPQSEVPSRQGSRAGRQSKCEDKPFTRNTPTFTCAPRRKNRQKQDRKARDP